MIFNDNVFENVGSNYYHQTLQTWYMSMKENFIIIMYYLRLIKSWKMLFNCRIC